MKRRVSSSTSVPLSRRASSLFSTSAWRRQSAVTNAEKGHNEAAASQEEAIHEEIDEIKRYEDFTTIDWVQDAAREQLRKRARRQEKAGFFAREGGLGWRRKLWESYDAAQGWIVVTLIGAAIGLNAAFLNIVTEWLSDIKLGYCTTAFYLNESFCCWGSESGCKEWHRWSSLAPINYVVYIVFSTLFAFLSARLVKAFAPYAAGSGISEIKCIIAGFVMKGFLGFWTLVIKSIGLPLAIASGLSVGKEGPSVHYAVCTGNVISKLFDKYRRNAAKTREILSACAAAGVAVAFGSPIGGVLFSLEEISTFFPLKTLWRSYYAALVATAVLAGMNPFRTGQLVMFQISYERSWHFFEIIFFIIIGIFGGLYGAFMMKWNLRAQAFRKKYLSKYAILEATCLALFTAVICYPNMFLRIDMTESMEILFRECKGDYDYNHLCEWVFPGGMLLSSHAVADFLDRKKSRGSLIASLAIATILRIFLVIISYGCKVPAGIFVPSMAIGASFGRMVGILVQMMHEASPDSRFFRGCEPDVPCITPGTYAFLGAGAALSGIMHITVSVVVIMFELTGALTYILPTMIVVGVTKAVAERFGRGGIADRMIWFNGFPFLDNKEDHSFGVPVSKAMTTTDHISTLPANGMTLKEVEVLLSNSSYQGFPIVEDHTTNTLLGYIGRTELRYAVDRARRSTFIPSHARCMFTSPSNEPTTPSNTATIAPAADLRTVSSGLATPGLPSYGLATPAINSYGRSPSTTFLTLGALTPDSTSPNFNTSLSPVARSTAEGDEDEGDDDEDPTSHPDGEPSSSTARTPSQPLYNPRVRTHHQSSTTTTPTADSPILDLHRFPDFTPLSVHPSLPLETAMELFKKLGPRVILVEYHGTLTGLVTVKDCLRYQFKAEAESHREKDERAAEEEARRLAEREEKVWGWIVRVGGWVQGKVSKWSRGRIVLGEPGVGVGVGVDSVPLMGTEGTELREGVGGAGGGDRGVGEEARPSVDIDELGRVVTRGSGRGDASVELEERFPGGGTGSS
ncbi:MAG: glycerol ethanol, ferric requiring protein [Alyxoria varia]|nr:MAG: glycerol ethanol, ferric requiring protein [Alyxoria varia]